jgi:4-alpha-glucanotransferase
MRASGILLPITSLPSNYGIGSFSKEAYEFIDGLKKAGQNYWQILPLGPTGYGDSPYQSFSTFAGNPYFIDPDMLVSKGLLTEEECESYDFGSDLSYVDYEKIYRSRFDLLRKAYNRSHMKTDKNFVKFLEANTFWLEDYAFYMAIKDCFGGLSMMDWPEDIRLRRDQAMEEYRSSLNEEIEFYQYQQFLFYEQWAELKAYANQNGVKLIGDIPIYVAYDSADTWSHPELFQLDDKLIPKAVAGCPPDAFSEDGQLWGNPLYRWEYHKVTGYGWWLLRISYSSMLYDVIRIDHFKGFDEYYSIPYGSENAVPGHWEKGPGYDFFQTLQRKLGAVDIIAEDLGDITQSVRKLLKKTGYPGMKVLEFAFSSEEESDYLPHNYDKNCVVYTGTHDNNTIKGWFEDISEEDRDLALRYMNKSVEDTGKIHWDIIHLAMQSVAELCIIPLQDYLGLSSDARMNTPSTIGDNWKWRLTKEELSEDLLHKIREITKLYGRLGKCSEIL